MSMLLHEVQLQQLHAEIFAPVPRTAHYQRLAGLRIAVYHYRGLDVLEILPLNVQPSLPYVVRIAYIFVL